MFHTLPRHAKYRPNSSPWLGDLPKHWLLARTKTLLNERNQKGYPEEPLLAATQRHGVIKKSDYENRTVTATKDLHLLKLVEVGDFVISLRSFQGGIERCYHRGIISPAYTVLTAKDEAHREFLTYLFKSRPFVDSLTLAVTGIREGQNIDYSRLEVDLLPLPPAEEQAAIVKYLAHANARIDKAITAKRRLIALLDEQRGATVRATLSAASDSSRPIAFVTAARLAKIDTGVEDSGNADPNGEYPFFVRGRQVLRASKFHFDTEAVLTPGDGQGGTGKVFHYYNGKFQAHQRVYVFSGFSGVIARFFYWYMTAFFREHALAQSNTVTMESLRRPVLASFRVAVPDELAQRSIVDSIEAQVASTAQAIEKTQREIALLQEFRTRLVADVVTGQVDVRAIAATLPDTPDVTDLVADSDEEQDEIADDDDE